MRILKNCSTGEVEENFVVFLGAAMKLNQMRSSLKAFVFILSATMFFAAGCRAQSAKKSDAPAHPWMNKSLSADERADMVIKQMTLDKKIQLVHGTGWGPLIPG